MIRVYFSFSLSLSLYIYIYIYIYSCGRFPRPASTKNTQVDTFCVRIEKTYPINRKYMGYMKTTYPTLRQENILCFLGPLRGMIRGYASGSVEG